jgi:phosphoglycolate phosphatase-like HAD superfamily hydrolase
MKCGLRKKRILKKDLESSLKFLKVERTKCKVIKIMNIKTIYFDFDGTLIDISKKMYEAYADFLQSQSKEFLSYQTFCDLKQSGMSIEGILKQTRAETILNVYLKKMPAMLEEDIYLGLDSTFEGIFEILKFLKESGIKVIVYSRRKNRKNLECEISNLALKGLITEIITGNIKKELKKAGPSDILIGDSILDIGLGKSVGLRTVGITTGFYSRSALLASKPDLVIDSLKEINSVLTTN